MRISAVSRLLGASDTANTVTVRKKVGERISELEEDLLELKEYQNSLCPAALLPAEILTHIFAIHRRQHQLEDEGYLNIPKMTLGWILVTHVCRRWRDVAVSCPTLWSELSFWKPAFTHIMLQRSRDAPLSVQFHCKNRPSEELQKVFFKVLSQTSRLREVRLYAADEGPMTFASILALFHNPAPCLETFALSDLSDLPQELPKSFLGGYAPRLRNLTLHPSPAHLWKTLPLGSTSLTKLMVRLVDDETRPAFDDFAAGLSHMPSLVTLIIFSHLPLGPISFSQLDQYQGGHTSVVLPALESLTLYDDIYSAHGFFSRVKMPRLTSIEMLLRCDTGDADALSPFLAAVEASSGGMARGNVGAFQILEHSPSGPRFTFEFANDSRLEMSLIGPAIHLQQSISACHARFDLSTITVLDITDTTSMDSASWTDVLSRLPKLSHIDFVLSSIDGFVESLKIMPQEEQAGEGTFHHFPALYAISLNRVHFNPEEPEEPEDSTAEATINSLIEGLHWREGKMRPVRELEIEECAEFFETDYLRIKERLPNLMVNWDGFTGATTWEELRAL
ncbi:hypothetical protein NMY22_g15416 [Coprinellus aureogranulatus]|nr:hypothetical protein NMY22_g15416 [Coprinellus aureogranulatus]